MDIEEINPFVLNFPIKVMSVNTRKNFGSDSKVTDAVAYEKDSRSHYYVEQQKKTSIYDHHSQGFNDIVFGRLSLKGRNLYLYIVGNMPENADYINLKLGEVRNVTGVSKASIIAAIKELRSAGILAPKRQSVYWVNPFHIFKGNRLRYYRSISEALVETVVHIKREE